MFETSTDKAWNALGAEKPYYSAVTSGEFLENSDTEKMVARFMATGEESIRTVFEIIHAGIDKAFRPKRAVDFGCGPGRFVIALATRCAEVVGLDISDPMLNEAEKNVRARNIGNVTLAKSDDDLSELHGFYDLIHSYIVFQHIPVIRGEQILTRLLDHLAREGIAVLHFTYARQASVQRRVVHAARKYVPLGNGIVNVLQGQKFSHPMMQMNAYDLNRLFKIVQTRGYVVEKCQFTSHSGGHLGVVLYIRNPLGERAATVP